MKKDKNKKGQRKWKKEIVWKNRNTEDGVILRGRGCNIPLVPKIYFVNTRVIVLVSSEELKAKAPPETKPCSYYKLKFIE